METNGSRREKQVEPDMIVVSEGMDRQNIRSYLLIYLAATAVHVGAVQAALCDKLGASATVANYRHRHIYLGVQPPFSERG